MRHTRLSSLCAGVYRIQYLESALTNYQDTTKTTGFLPIRTTPKLTYRGIISLSHPAVSGVHARGLSDELHQACVKLGGGATLSCHPHSRGQYEQQFHSMGTSLALRHVGKPMDVIIKRKPCKTLTRYKADLYCFGGASTNAPRRKPRLGSSLRYGDPFD